MFLIGINCVVDFEIKSAYNAQTFLNFIENKIIEDFGRNHTKVLIMGNIRFHHGEFFKNILTVNHIFKYLPT